MGSIVNKWWGESATERLKADNRELQENADRRAVYIRKKTNQLLAVMGTLPLRSDESDKNLLESDHIGVMAESLQHIIDQKKQLDEVFRKTREELLTVLSMSAVAMLICDDSQRGVHCNRQMAELLGIEVAVAGERIEIPSGLVVQGALADACRKIVETRRPARMEQQTINGRLVDLAGVPVKNQHGEVIRIVLTAALSEKV
ncbi:MAG TPA: hypothetical protein HPP76_09965 [Desulfuromonadales bacterium]|nr:hypothetical protein [Desulfuromonadales bacterium]